MRSTTRSSTRLFSTASLRALGLGVLVAWSSPALAGLSCDDIMSMVNANVPVNIVVNTMENSGSTFSASDVACLESKSAPGAVLDVAKRLQTHSAPATSTTPPPTADDEPSSMDDFKSAGGLGSAPPATDSASDDAGDKGPAKLEALIDAYRAKKVLTASKGLYELLESGEYPDQQPKIQYYLAKSLYDMGLYHPAQHYFMQVVRRGPRNPYFKYALPRLVAIAQHTGNDYELLRIVDKIPPEQFPRAARNHLFYLMGRKEYDKDELSSAAKYFQQISSKSDLFLRAKYYEGVINNKRDKLRSAVKAFRDVYQAEVLMTDARSAQDLEDLKDLALINIARTYFRLQRFDNAENYYALVSRDSTYWPQSLFERGWTNFYRNDMNLTLGLLLTVNSPYYSDHEFIPEVTVLRALTYFTLCEYDDVDQILTGFEADYNPMVTEISDFLDKYKTKEGRKLADQAFDAYFTDDHADSKLKSALFSRVLRNRDLAALVRHLDMMDSEEKLIDEKKAIWRDSVGEGLKKIIEKDRIRYKKRAGLTLLQEMLEQQRSLKDLLVQSEIIRFEVVDAQRVDYEFKMQNPNIEAHEDQKIDFATSKEIIYWPFNGEFWRDELGYYRYAEHGACK